MCKVWKFSFAFTLLTLIFDCSALDNGLALTPPMGWLAWTRFLCEIDCAKYPKDCISEKLFTEMADILVTEGYREAGYIHVNLDDCWMRKTRSSEGKLVADPQRFPHGIKCIYANCEKNLLCPYFGPFQDPEVPELVQMHNRSMKLGIYENYGRQTCMGFPGSENHMQTDAETFIEWNVDMLKFDGCFNDPTTLDKAFPQMGHYLNESGKKIIYSCSWPYYVRKELRTEPNYEEIMRHCNLWRNFDDIQIHWKSIESIINFYDEHQEKLSSFHGPGHWNDPDMIVIGNPGLTADQCRAQMALWAIWSAPLLMSNDLREIRPEFKEILLNHRVIAVNQDPMGLMGKKIKQLEGGKISIYLKPITSKYLQAQLRSFAVVFLNRDEYKMIDVRISLGALNLPFRGGYSVEDLFFMASSNPRFLVTLDEPIEVKIPPTGVVMWRLDPHSPEKHQPALPQTSDYNLSGFWWICALIFTAFVFFCFKRLRLSRVRRIFRLC